MTPAKLRRLIARLNKQDPSINQTTLAKRIGCSDRAMRDWLAGKKIFGPAERLLEALWAGDVTLADLDKYGPGR